MAIISWLGLGANFSLPYLRSSCTHVTETVTDITGICVTCHISLLQLSAKTKIPHFTSLKKHISLIC